MDNNINPSNDASFKDKYIDPTYDVGFKLTFGRENHSEELLIGMLLFHTTPPFYKGKG